MPKDAVATHALDGSPAKPPHTLASKALFAPIFISLQRHRQQIFNA